MCVKYFRNVLQCHAPCQSAIPDPRACFSSSLSGFSWGGKIKIKWGTFHVGKSGSPSPSFYLIFRFFASTLVYSTSNTQRNGNELPCDI